MWLWRISNYADLKGIGGLRASGWWHYAGQPVVYFAEHPALTLPRSGRPFSRSKVRNLEGRK